MWHALPACHEPGRPSGRPGLAVKSGQQITAARPPARGRRGCTSAGLSRWGRSATDRCRARGQELLDTLVAITRPRLFLRQVEGLADRAGSDHVERPRLEGIHALHGPTGVEIAADVVEARKQCLAVVGPRAIDATGQAQVL